MFTFMIRWMMADRVNRGFRDPFIDNDAAVDAMMHACLLVGKCARDQRYYLLQLGFADTHGLCREFDKIDRNMNDDWLNLRDAQLRARIHDTAPL